MKISSRMLALCSCVALVCCGMAMSTGCGDPRKSLAESSQAAIEIRFQDGDRAQPQDRTNVLRLAEAAPGPTTHDSVARVLVDIRFADTGQPFFTNLELTKLAPDVWRTPVPLLPRNQQLRFAARALDATGGVAFSGDTLATLTVDNQNVQIPLAPAQNNQTFQMPRMFRIVYPTDMFAGQEEQVTFTIEANAGQAIAIQITPLATPATPAAEFLPATGSVTLTNTVADFMTAYAPPQVTVDTDFDYQVTITAPSAQSAVAITSNFRIHVKPRPAGIDIVASTQPSVLFNPVILSLTANGSEIPNTIELFAAVSDDSAPDQLAYQWSYAPDPGTAPATFASSDQGNPGLFQGYTVAHRGTITLAVTDEHNGTTTLHYPLVPDQFADAVDHAPVDGIRRIVAGNAHTCVLTGDSRVRCWGDNHLGQLGYGHAIDVGDAPSRLPYVAGDVPLPVSDPVQQLVAGNNHTCALLSSGLVYCWGDNQFGQLGYGRTDNLGDGEPVTSFGYVTLGGLATLIAAGGDHTCAILATGALRCWGRNDFGQLGHGNTVNLGDDEAVYSAGDVILGTGIIVKDLALGEFHTCALLTRGTVRCWGLNSSGQLGYGNTENLGDNESIRGLPNVSLTDTVRKVVAGAAHTCALAFAGTLRCWGDNGKGQLGQNIGNNGAWGDQVNEVPSNLPGDTDTGAPVTDVAAGGEHTCALSSDGRLKCWGRSDSGQLGYGDFASQSTPPAAGVDLDGTTAYRITAGTAHTCALRSNGTARCWGAGADGRLGRGSTASGASATGKLDIQIFAPPPTCGNGALDPGEQCDDGNTVNDAVCDYNCTAPGCSNGILDPGEQCDDGNLLSGDGCENNCTLSHSVGGSMSGLRSGQSVVLQYNGGNDLTISANGGFTFTTQVPSGSPYAVTVRTNPSGMTCTVTNGSGTVATSNLTNVAVTCTANPCTLPWGGSINDGQSVTAYQAPSVSCNSSCVSEIRTCSLGVLSGTFTNPSCSSSSCTGAFSYGASNTNSASQNTINFNLFLFAGQTLTAGTCGVPGSSGFGDTFLRLFNPSNILVALNDDACGLLSHFTFTATTTGAYQLRAGCFSDDSCSGTVAYTLSP